MRCIRLLPILILACSTTGQTALAQNKADEPPPPRPNILLIVTDDQGWWDVGVHGNETLDTPSLDRLAREGVRFSRFYVQPVCAPTRAGLMTGRYYLRTGLYNTRFGGDTLPDSEITLAELLQQNGYATGLFGKWHLGSYKRYAPENQGFDESLYFQHGHTERYDYPDELKYNGEAVDARGYVTDLFTDAAIGFMTQRRDRPFFCYVAYNVPHSPFIVGNAHGMQDLGDAFIAKYLARGVPLREARIYGMIERCDQNVGRLLETLERMQAADETIVLFLSDNGGIHGHYTAGLRGRKGSVYEGGVRSPFFARWSEHFPAGAVVDSMASHVDILPTLCDLLKIPVPMDRRIDGQSLRGLLETGSGRSPHPFVYHTWNRYVPVPDRNWAICSQRYKLANGQLFDLEEDPGETTDIADKDPKLVAEMRDEYLLWYRDATAGKTYRPVPIEVGRDDENPVELQASWASLDGKNTSYEFRAYNWDTISGWKELGESAEWRLRVVQSGRYEVVAVYGARPASAGGRFSIQAQLSRLEGTVEATPTPDVFIHRPQGILELQAGPTTLKFRVEESRGDELMHLNRIRLKRLDE